MSESRTIYIDDEWLKVSCCLVCAFRKNIDGSYYCFYDNGLSAELKIRDDCPLPKWERMRWHSPDEHPENNEVVLLKFRCIPNSSYDTGIFYRMGYIIENSDDWSCFDKAMLGAMSQVGNPLILSRRYLYSWRYINK